MKSYKIILLGLFFLTSNRCVTPYIPVVTEKEQLLVVQGLITDQPGINKVKLSRSKPLWKPQAQEPLKGCEVWITDDFGKIDSLKELIAGTYVTDSATFRGVVNNHYTLHVRTNDENGEVNYESFPTEMKPVPPIDSIYYEKRNYVYSYQPYEGCQIFLDTHDPDGHAGFYRWDYSETWEYHLPYSAVNGACWASTSSDRIFIKSSTDRADGRISHFPINLITNPIDRLTVRYSIMVNQYSMNEDEYLYWQRLLQETQMVGGLYDIIPASIPNNIFCLEYPDEIVLGYFSVSAMTSERKFIQDHFVGINNSYNTCNPDTIYGTAPIDGLNISLWLMLDNSDSIPPVRIITSNRSCAECLARGTSIKPLFWK